ncbi:MAG: DNA polymerase III subunit beta [Candidatus Omnitrophota bacterium]
MKFIINKNIIVEELLKIIGPTTTKQNLPILSSIFIETKNNTLKIISTDLDITIITKIKTTVLSEGRAVVPSKRFISIIKEMPSCDITVEKVKNDILINCEKIEFKLTTFPVEDFPKIEEQKKAILLKINPQTLHNMIVLTSFSVGFDDINYVLGGVLFELFENKINLVSTDQKRLSFSQEEIPASQPPTQKKLNLIIPLKAVYELQKLIKEEEDDILLFTSENKVGFDIKKTQFIARLIEGEFPNYKQFIPPESKNKLTVNRKDFILTLRRADTLSNQDYQSVKINLKKDSITVTKTTPQEGEVKEVVEGNYTGEPIQIGFNPKYLIDALKNLKNEKTVFEFFGPDKPAVVREGSYTYLVLPMTI